MILPNGDCNEERKFWFVACPHYIKLVDSLPPNLFTLRCIEKASFATGLFSFDPTNYRMGNIIQRLRRRRLDKTTLIEFQGQTFSPERYFLSIAGALQDYRIRKRTAEISGQEWPLKNIWYVIDIGGMAEIDKLLPKETLQQLELTPGI